MDLILHVAFWVYLVVGCTGLTLAVLGVVLSRDDDPWYVDILAVGGLLIMGVAGLVGALSMHLRFAGQLMLAWRLRMLALGLLVLAGVCLASGRSLKSRAKTGKQPPSHVQFPGD